MLKCIEKWVETVKPEKDWATFSFAMKSLLMVYIAYLPSKGKTVLRAQVKLEEWFKLYGPNYIMGMSRLFVCSSVLLLVVVLGAGLILLKFFN